MISCDFTFPDQRFYPELTVFYYISYDQFYQSLLLHCRAVKSIEYFLKKVLVKLEHICGNTFSLFYVALDSIILSVIKVRPWKETTMNLEAKFKLKSTNLSFIWTM